MPAYSVFCQGGCFSWQLTNNSDAHKYTVLVGTTHSYHFLTVHVNHTLWLFASKIIRANNRMSQYRHVHQILWSHLQLLYWLSAQINAFIQDTDGGTAPALYPRITAWTWVNDRWRKQCCIVSPVLFHFSFFAVPRRHRSSRSVELQSWRNSFDSADQFRWKATVGRREGGRNRCFDRRGEVTRYWLFVTTATDHGRPMPIKIIHRATFT